MSSFTNFKDKIIAFCTNPLLVYIYYFMTFVYFFYALYFSFIVLCLITYFIAKKQSKELISNHCFWILKNTTLFFFLTMFIYVGVFMLHSIEAYEVLLYAIPTALIQGNLDYLQKIELKLLVPYCLEFALGLYYLFSMIYGTRQLFKKEPALSIF